MAHSKIQWDVEENKSCPKENTKLTYCASLYFSTHSGLGKSQSVIRQETKDSTAGWYGSDKNDMRTKKSSGSDKVCRGNNLPCQYHCVVGLKSLSTRAKLVHVRVLSKACQLGLEPKWSSVCYK